MRGVTSYLGSLKKLRHKSRIV
ncbi:hypothetical protein U2A4042390021 [Corynebacterium striatum]|nr:hypothetical protein U2A4042390021 [Corynebacterium striatum]